MADRFLIAPIESGLQTDVRPWLVPDTAFARMNNAYVYHGRVRKRFGSVLMNTSVSDELQPLYSRFRINIGTTDAVTGNFSVTAPGTIFKVGQQFSIGDTVFTVSDTGTPATLLTTGTATGTYNTTSGALVITGNTENPSTTVYFYPAEPVMGFVNYENSSINNEPTYAFDTQFSYQFTGGSWQVLSTTAAGTWTGTNSDFFWSENYRGIAAYDGYLFTTNFTATDRIRYWNGSTWTILTGAGIQYDSTGGNEILTARLIISFKGRLLLMNTIEDLAGMNRSYPNRLRYCQVGDPISAGQTPWREDIGGKGGFIDAPTKQAIISSRIIKDRLIVYFERSTYELVYTNNQEFPFKFVQVNSELGVESTFSTVTFDRSIIGIGSTGIHSCNGAYVERIDEKIQDEVFAIKNSGNGVERVYGIRDYFAQIVYWTIPSNTETTNYPDRVLVFNYENGTWAFNDDTITAFGYFQRSDGLTWAEATQQWIDADDVWASGQLQAQFRDVVAGNQEGFVFICNHESLRNSPSLQISKMTIAAGLVTLVVTDHNIKDAEFIAIENAQGVNGLNDTIYQVTVVDDDTLTINEPSATGTYTGMGTLARVSRIDIITKQYNFYVGKGRNAHVNSINFFVDKTDGGEITVEFRPDSTTLNVTSLTLETSPYALYPLEEQQEQLWHHIYPNAEGNLIQLRIYLSDEQLMSSAIAWSDFEMHAMLFNASPTSMRLQ